MSIRSIYYLKSSFDTLEFNREDLDNFQNKMINDIIFEAERSGLYGKWNNGTKECIEDFPFIESAYIKTQISKNQKFNGEKFERQSSGSTGDPVRIEFNRQAHEWLSAIYVRTLLLQGYRPPKEICQLWEGMSDQRSLFGRLFMPKEYMDPSLELSEQINKLNNSKPKVLQYFPMTLLAICKKVRSEDIDFFSPELVITYGEIITPEVQNFIEETLETKVVDQYNMTEFGVVAWQCPEGGYHLVEDAFFPEFIGYNGNKIEGEGIGELVITGLVNTDTPLVRYNTGDVVELTEDKCSCETKFTKIQSIKGRKEKVIQNCHGEKIYPSDVVSIVGPIEDLLFFQLEYEEDRIILNYVPNGSISESSVNNVISKLSDKLGVSEVVAVEKESIEKTSCGKISVVKKAV